MTFPDVPWFSRFPGSILESEEYESLTLEDTAVLRVVWDRANRNPSVIVFNGRAKTIPAGSLVTSLAKLAAEAKVSIQSVRTALKNLVALGFLTKQTSSHPTKGGTLLCIVGYERFDDLMRRSNKAKEDAPNTVATRYQQSSNNRINDKTRNEKGENDERCAPVVVAVDPDFEKSVSLLTAQGLTSRQAERLAKVATLETIRNQIEWIERRSYDNRTAFLYRAIAENWDEPKAAQPSERVNGIGRPTGLDLPDGFAPTGAPGEPIRIPEERVNVG